MARDRIPFDLVEVKLAAPLTRPGTVAKADVIARLCAASVPLATVVAPAGYGKTTLLARWAEADPRPFAWVALDGRDDDAVVFLRYIAAAIHRVEPLPPEVFDALSGPGASAWATRVPRVGRALAAIERPAGARAGRSARRRQSVLSGRARGARPVRPGRLADRGREQGGAGVAARPLAGARMGATRSAWRTSGSTSGRPGLLLEAAGVELEASELSELTEQTEGWPAGLYLAALSMQAGAAGPTGVEGFTGDDRFVSDYFRLELLSRLPADEAQFLTHTSVLERMCGGLCDAVLETTGSAQTLETLERTNGFVVPLDRRGEWYRYHHLFGQLLRNELERSEPDVVPTLNRRAMAWCIANDLPEEAIVYGHAAGETETVAGLVDALACRSTTTAAWRPWRSGSRGSATTSSWSTLRSPSTEPGSAC